MDVYFVYVTCASVEQAEQLGEAAVAEKLAACANILPAMRSIYFWQGELQRDQETVLLLKTSEARLSALRQRLAALHSYDNPCIVDWPLADGAPAYLQWVRDNTRLT